MVGHSSTTRAAKAARVYGAGHEPRETEGGTALDAAPCEGLEEPAKKEGEASPARMSFAGIPEGPVLNSIEELDGRVSEIERNMLVLGQRADQGCQAWGSCVVLGKRLDALQRDVTRDRADARIEGEDCERRYRMLAAALAGVFVCVLVAAAAILGR